MADKPNLNPEPVPGPADVTKKKKAELPKAPAVDAKTETKGVWQGAFSALGQAFDQIKKNPEPVLLFVGVYVGLAVLTAISNGGFSPAKRSYFSYEGLAGLIFLLALPTYALALADKKVISLAEFMKFDLGRYFSLFAAYILISFIIIFSILPLVIFWIWTLAWFWLTGYALVDKKLGPIQALKESKRLAQNNKAKVWGLVGAYIVVSIAAGLLSFVPLVGAAAAAFVSVLMAGASAILYRWLQQNVPQAQE